jgi:hypothetical protein
MKRYVVFFLIASTMIVIVSSCSKHSSGPDAGHGPNSLFPLTAGDTWYYQDSVFNDSALVVAYPDTMTVNSQRVQGANLDFVGLTNPYGWFSGSYILVDPSNTTVLEVDDRYGRGLFQSGLSHSIRPVWLCNACDGCRIFLSEECGGGHRL